MLMGMVSQLILRKNVVGGTGLARRADGLIDLGVWSNFFV
jgi:hypothetical protein